jgi:hypothetical protein
LLLSSWAAEENATHVSGEQTLDNKHDESKLIGRRHALRLFGVGIGAAGGLVLLGCSKGGGGSSGGGTSAAACAQMGNPDAAAQQLRKTLQYKEKSDFPDKNCANCAQYEAAKYAAADCGGCKLFAGGVKPEGYCLSYAPLQGAPGAQPAAPAGGAAPAKPPG